MAGLCHHLLFYEKIMDENLTKKVQAYLEMNPADRNVEDGATMLLSLNRNRLLFQRVMRKPEMYADKVEYELKKFLRIRLDHKTVQEVVRMNETVVPSARLTLEEGAPVISTDEDKPQSAQIAKGKRADHDNLPEPIKALWDECSSLWFGIKDLFEQLKQMEQAPACDRYEYLVQLEEMDRKYRANMKAYDAYTPGMEIASGQPAESDDPATIAKRVGAARKYLSDNKKKLAELKISDENEYVTLLAKVQERYDYLVSTGNAVDAEQVSELAALGVKVE